MTNTFKRIIALAIVLCTLGAMMIPGVSAAENDLVVDFKASANNAGVAASQYFSDATVVEKLTTAYEANGWKPYGLVYSVYPARFYGTALALAVRANNLNTYQYLPLQFTAPADGDYSLTLSIHSNVNVPLTDFRAYVVPVPETTWDKNALNTAMNAKLSETALLQYNPTEITSGKVSDDEKVSLEGGKEYLLVLCTYGTKDGTVLLTGFTLTYHEPEKFVPLGSETIDFTALDDDLSIAENTVLVSGHTLQAGGTTVNNAYDNETAPYAWGLVSGHRNGLNQAKFYNNSLWISSSTTNASASVVGKKIGVALKLRSPGAGKYDVSLEYVARPGNDVADELFMYILPLPKSDLFSSENMYDGKTAYTYMFAGAINNPNYAVQEMDGTVVGYLNDTVLTTPIQDAAMEGTNAVRVAKGESFEFEANKEYMVVLAIGETSEETAILQTNGKTGCSAEIRKLNFTPYADEASIEGKYEGTLAGALDAAVAGDTIVLGKDVTVTGAIDLKGAILDLNGKTLTGSVVGTVKDSSDGEGLVATGSKESVISTVDGQIALWDSTTVAQGYRIFNFELASHGVSGKSNQNKVVDFSTVMSDYSLNNGQDLVNGYTLYDSGNAINTDYDDGKVDFALVAGHRNRISHVRAYFGSIRLTGRSTGNIATEHGFAMKVKSPGEGDFRVSVGYIARPGDDVADKLNVYIVPMPEFDFWTQGSGYELNNIGTANPLYEGGPTVGEADRVLTTAVQDITVAASQNRVAQGDVFNFKADKEYMVIFTVSDATHANANADLINLTFTADNSRSFWSTLKFKNTDAYALVEASDLKVGFEMTWNGDATNSSKTFEFEDSAVAEWGNTQAADLDTTYGFYIRVGGFEALGESGALTAKPYIKVANKTVYPEKDMTYTYTAE